MLRSVRVFFLLAAWLDQVQLSDPETCQAMWGRNICVSRCAANPPVRVSGKIVSLLYSATMSFQDLVPEVVAEQAELSPEMSVASTSPSSSPLAKVPEAYVAWPGPNHCPMFVK